MSIEKRRSRTPAGMRVIKVTVPEDVADFYDREAHYYGGSKSAAAAPVLIARARGDIRQEFVQAPGTADKLRM